MRTGYLAADFEWPERLNRAPECWNSFKMPNPKDLADVFGWPDCLESGMQHPPSRGSDTWTAIQK
jgi:hypothetical protein